MRKQLQLHADSEKGEVVNCRVGGVETAEMGSYLIDRTAVVGLAGEQSELTRNVADVDIKRYIELGRVDYVPYPLSLIHI